MIHWKSDCIVADLFYEFYIIFGDVILKPVLIKFLLCLWADQLFELITDLGLAQVIEAEHIPFEILPVSNADSFREEFGTVFKLEGTVLYFYELR
jgi:hypothetical protein